MQTGAMQSGAMQTVLRVGIAVLLAGTLGVGLGLATGWVAFGRGRDLPADAPPPGTPLAPEVVLPVAPTAADVDVQQLLREKAVAKPHAPAAADAHAAPAPDVLEEAPLVGDPSLLPRGPGKTALLDLEAAGLGSVLVRVGALNRDGAANWARFAKTPKVASLAGPQARVELLHLGLDAEARPVLIHVRTVDEARAEGVISLLTGDVRIPVLADPDPPDLTPPPVKPPPEEEPAPE